MTAAPAAKQERRRACRQQAAQYEVFHFCAGSPGNKKEPAAEAETAESTEQFGTIEDAGTPQHSSDTIGSPEHPESEQEHKGSGE